MFHVIQEIKNAVQRRLRRKPNKYRLSLSKKIYLRFKRNKNLNKEKILNGVIKYNCAPYWFKQSYQEIFEQETYRFTDPSKKDLLIIDCGSNIGLSIIYYKLHYPNAKVIGVEPDPAIFSLLEANLNQYNFDKITLYNKAAWINNDHIEFLSKGGMGGLIINENDHIEGNSVKIPALRLKDLLNEEVDFLKMDIEGAELEVLNDCRPLLKNVKSLFVEYHCYKNQEQKLDELLELLKSAGFRVYFRQAYENLQYPFIQKTGEFMDMQLNIFCFRKDDKK